MSKSFREDLTGQRFGRLTVIGFVPTDNNRTYWKCQCDCGNVITVWGYSLTKGNTKSCGCWKRDNPKLLFSTHKKRNTKLYGVWNGMKNRCYNPNARSYKDYGGRGITICDEWRNDFKAFYDWAMANGYTDELSIDRIDVNGNYEPNNCRWLDKKTQSRNRRNTVFVEYKGENISIAEASERSGINRATLAYRYRIGERGEILFRSIEK